jgi:hypothetical protein
MPELLITLVLALTALLALGVGVVFARDREARACLGIAAVLALVLVFQLLVLASLLVPEG